MINWMVVKGLAKSSKVWILVAVLALSNAASYYLGKANQRTEFQQERAEKAEEQVRVVIKEVEKRVPIVQIKETESQKARLRINQLEEELIYATQQRKNNSTCDLSDAEYDGWLRLGEEINSTADRSNLQR